jgi:hypothetical protein
MNHATSPGLLWKMDTASAKEIIMIPVTTSICADLLEEKKQCAISPKSKELNNYSLRSVGGLVQTLF